MADKNAKQPVKPVTKPYLTGNLTDERTWKSVLGFFGLLLIAAFMTFLVCSMMNLGNAILRIGFNCIVEVLVLLIFYNNAANQGSEAVARGEILWQRQEKGLTFSESEKALSFHPMKGFLIGILGTIPLLIPTLILAVTTSRQTTGIGVLPSWMNIYERRTEVGDALVAYTAQAGMSFTDIVRLIVRIMIMPFVTIVGAENKEGLLLLERLSPLIALLPAAAYGTGYLQGKSIRTKVHTEIASSNRKRARKERKAILARRKKNAAPKGPEQLN